MTESALAIPERPTSMEVASSASAALAKATIEAKYVIALRQRRNPMECRSKILESCRNPRFAEGAWYRRKQGRKEVNGRWEDNYVEGLSIRFAETAIQCWRNIDVSATTAWENDDNRLVRITVTDLETNISYTDEVMLAKTVERRKVREGQDVIGKRETSTGETVFIVRTTDEELITKLNAAKSKVIRNSGLRLLPRDILDEASEAIAETRQKGAAAVDPKAAAKKLADAFGTIGVSVTDLELYLKHSLDRLVPSEIADLRSIFTAIRDGEARWADYVTADDDQIPGAEVKPATATTTATQSTATGQTAAPAPKAEASSEATPQQRLAELVRGAGCDFSDFVAWGQRSGNVADASSIPSFDDVPTALASRLLRAKDGLVKQLREAKAATPAA